MTRKVCLAIGVSEVVKPVGSDVTFALLDGAVVAAEAIGTWAIQAGFGAENVQVVTDRLGPDGTQERVTQATVQAAVNALFPAGAEPVSYFLLHYCGHGLTGTAIESTFWLFSDSHTGRYKVNVDSFVAELVSFGIQRISVVSDACRDGPPDLAFLRFDAVRGIDGIENRPRSPMFDRLTACQDGKKGYMVGDNTSAEPGKCILSGVVLDVLWGQEPAAFLDDVIDTSRFAAVTRSRATERAAGYHLELDPFCMVDPMPATLVQRPIGDPVPPLRPWPTTSQGSQMGPVALPNGEIMPRDAVTSNLQRLNDDAEFRESVLGKKFGASHPGIEGMLDFQALPEDARNLANRLIVQRDSRSRDDAAEPGADQEALVLALEGQAAKAVKKASARRLSEEMNALANIHSRNPNVNLIVTGGNIRAIWSTGETSVLDRPTEGWAIQAPPRRGGSQLVIEFDDGLFAPVFIFPKLFVAIFREATGVSGIAYGRDSYDYSEAVDLVHDLALGRVEPGQVQRVSAEIRYDKHINPIRGAAAAYLYRAVADLDNIHRMAYYYTRHNQAIPFDIALLGNLDIKRQQMNLSDLAVVPSVAAGGHSELPGYAFKATRGAQGRLAGFSPWLTMGWDYPRPTSQPDPGPDREGIYDAFRRYGGESARIRGAIESRDPITGSRSGLARSAAFTSFWGFTGRSLAQLWDLERQPLDETRNG